MKLNDVRLSFPRLYTAEDYQGNKKFRYDASFRVVKGSAADKAIEAEIIAKATADLGTAEKAKKWIATVRGQKNQDAYRADPEDATIMVLSSHRAQKDGPPGVFDNIVDANAPADPVTGKKPVRRIAEGEGRVYAGCYVNATVEIYVQTVGTTQGIRCGLQAVQFHRDGDSFGGAKPANQADFEAVEEGADADDIA